MANPQDKVSIWGVAIGGSLLIHAVILGLLALTSGGGTTPPEEEVVPPEQVAGDVAPEPGGRSAGTVMPSRRNGDAVAPEPGGGSGATETQVAAPAAESPAAGPVLYEVRQGDNLTRIARACGSTVAELAALNGKPVKRLEKLWVGQKIKLPRPIAE